MNRFCIFLSVSEPESRPILHLNSHDPYCIYLTVFQDLYKTLQIVASTSFDYLYFTQGLLGCCTSTCQFPAGKTQIQQHKFKPATHNGSLHGNSWGLFNPLMYAAVECHQLWMRNTWDSQRAGRDSWIMAVDCSTLNICNILCEGTCFT